MATVFTTILNMSLTASIIILIVLMARLCLKKAPKIYSYLLWAVVLFRLLCPVSFSLPVSVLAPVSEASTSTGSTLTGSMEYISVPERPEQPVQHQHDGLGENTTPVDGDTTQNIHDESASVVEQQPTQKPAGEIALAIFGWLWAVGMVGVLGFTTWQTLALKRKLATACIIRGNIFESEEIDTAFILGVINPKIYLPLDLPFDIQKAVVAHEQTHQRRGDHIVKLVSYIALALHWFNPLVWLSFKLMCEDMEKSCDEAVIRTMNDRGYTMNSTKKAYGHMLLALGGGKQHIFSPVSFAENSTKSRVKNLVGYNRVAKNTAIALAAVCVLVVGLCVVNPTGAEAAVSNTDIIVDSTVDNVVSSGEIGAAENIIEEPERDPNAEQLVIGGKTYWSDTRELNLMYDSPRGDELQLLTRFTRLEKLVLYCSHEEAYDLSVLSQIPTLKTLELGDNYQYPSDLSFLANCKNLESLTLSNEYGEHCNNGRLDIVGKIPNLKKLDITVDGAVKDLSFLSECSQLQELGLNLEVNDTESVSVIAQLDNLRALSLCLSGYQENSGIDYSFLTDCNKLEELSFSGSCAEELALVKIPTLRCFSGSTDGSMEFISNFENLEELELHAYDCFDGIKPLSRLTSLKNLDLALLTSDLNVLGSVEMDTVLYDLSPLASLTELTELRLDAYYSSLRDISFVEDMNNLEVLECFGSWIDTLHPLDGKAKLKVLNLNDWGAVDGYFPRGLESLETLNIAYESSMGENISSCRNLKYLSSTHEAFTSSSVDFSRLDKLEHINTLWLQNKETDKVVMQLPNLREISISVEDYRCLNCLEYAKELRSLSVEIWNLDDNIYFPTMENLEYLELVGSNGIDETHIAPDFSNLRNLRCLAFTKNRNVVDISSLAGHPSLEILYMPEFTLTEVSTLATIENLAYVEANCTGIADISALYGHKGLGSGKLIDTSTLGGRIASHDVTSDIQRPTFYLYDWDDTIPMEQAIELYNSLEHHCRIWVDKNYTLEEQTEEQRAELERLLNSRSDEVLPTPDAP